MTKALDSAGVPYKLANGGTEIDVPAAQTSTANVALAEKGAHRRQRARRWSSSTRRASR